MGAKMLPKTVQKNSKKGLQEVAVKSFFDNVHKAQEWTSPWMTNGAWQLYIPKGADRSTVARHRPITLESAVARFHERQKVSVCSVVLELAGYWTDTSFAYRKEMGPVTASFYSRSICSLATADGSSIFIAEWDESGAFTRIDREQMTHLEAAGCPESSVRWRVIAKNRKKTVTSSHIDIS